MALHVQCARCGAKLKAPEKLAGKRLKCPKCSAAITVSQGPSQSSGQATPAKSGATPTVVTCDCGKKLQAKAELAGKRVKCPACGHPLAIPGPRPADAQPGDGLDLDLLAGAVADAEAMPSSPLRPLVKKKQSSNTGLIVGLSVRAGAAVLVVLLIVLMWPSGKDNDLAKNESQGTDQPTETVQIPSELEDEYPWREESAPFDVAEFLAPMPEDENAAPLYFEALLEFSTHVVEPDEEKQKVLYAERGPELRKRWDQFKEFDAAWRKDPASVNLAAVDAWLKGYETGFEKLAEAQKRPVCKFRAGFSIESLNRHVSAASNAARVVRWRCRRVLARGDIERPIQDVETILRLSRDLRQGGPMFSQIMSLALQGIVCQTGPGRLARTAPPEDGLVPAILATRGITTQHCDRLLAALTRHETEAIDPFLESQRAEYVSTRKLLHDFQHRTGEFGQESNSSGSKPFLFPLSYFVLLRKFGYMNYPPVTEKYGNYIASNGSEELSGKSKENWQRLLAMTDEDHAKEVEAVNRVWEAILGLENKTLAQRQRAVDSGSLLDPLRQTYVAGLFVRDHEVHQAFFIHEAYLRGTQCLVALGRWQLENDQPPEDLQTVVKAAGMTGVPMDPYCDQPMRMTTIQGRPVIYSVGPDGKDNKAQREYDFNYTTPSGDLLFCLPARQKN